MSFLYFLICLQHKVFFGEGQKVVMNKNCLWQLSSAPYGRSKSLNVVFHVKLVVQWINEPWLTLAIHWHKTQNQDQESCLQKRHFCLSSYDKEVRIGLVHLESTKNFCVWNVIYLYVFVVVCLATGMIGFCMIDCWADFLLRKISFAIFLSVWWKTWFIFVRACHFQSRN